MLSRVPFVCFVAFFMIGILLGENCIPVTFISSIVLTAASAITGIGYLYFYFRKINFIPGISLSLSLIVSGALTTVLHNHRLVSDLETLSNKEYSYYEAIIKSLPEKRAKTIRMEAVITRIRFDSIWKDEDVKALISLPIDASVVPKPGDYIVVNGNLNRANKSLNLEEFDYRRYLWNKGIIWTAYLNENTYNVIPTKNNLLNPGLWSITVSEWADRKFRDNIKNDRSYGLVKAMLLGRRDDLRSDQVDDYTTSGTVHILSVSGMHVAIIFLVISMAFKWMKRWQLGKYIYLFTVTALLGFYALVTGLPPSVQRATLMCIVFIVAEAFSRKQSSMNTLAISALLILIMDPHALYDVGFQLSFLAMAGIFLLYEPIELIWKPANPVLKYVWQITAMSFAAQLATFPLSLYYFHQFPFYFWLINPFVIVFTNFLLPASMIMLLVSLFNFADLQFIANWWVEASAYLTNVSVSVPKLLPGYLVENLYLDKIEVILLYFFIFALWYSYYKQEYLILKRTAVIVLLFAFYSLSTAIQTYFSQVAIIHSVPKHSVISFKEGNRLFISSDKAFETDANSYKFHIKNYAISQGISEIIYLPEKQDISFGSLTVKDLEKGRLLAWNGLLISHGEYIDSKIFNYSLLSSGKLTDAPESANKQSTFLLGGEIRGKKRKQWEDYFGNRQSKFYDLSEEALLLHGVN